MGINARSTLCNHHNGNLDITVVQPDDLTNPGMMHVINRVTPSFQHYSIYEVNSTDCTPTSDLMENASYGR